MSVIDCWRGSRCGLVPAFGAFGSATFVCFMFSNETISILPAPSTRSSAGLLVGALAAHHRDVGVPGARVHHHIGDGDLLGVGAEQRRRSSGRWRRRPGCRARRRWPCRQARARRWWPPACRRRTGRRRARRSGDRWTTSAVPRPLPQPSPRPRSNSSPPRQAPKLPAWSGSSYASANPPRLQGTSSQPNGRSKTYRANTPLRDGVLQDRGRGFAGSGPHERRMPRPNPANRRAVSPRTDLADKPTVPDSRLLLKP